MKKCYICGSTDVDDYGCLKCLIRYANKDMWKKIIDEEENDKNV